MTERTAHLLAGAAILLALFAGFTIGRAFPEPDPQVDRLVELTRTAGRNVPGAQPDLPVTITWASELHHEATGHTAPGGLVVIETYQTGRPLEYLILHEVAHALTPGDGHGDIWREVYKQASDALRSETP